MVQLREIVGKLMEYQLEDYPDEMIREKQEELKRAYDEFTGKYGLSTPGEMHRRFQMIPLIICSALWRILMKTARWKARLICLRNGRSGRNGK